MRRKNNELPEQRERSEAFEGILNRKVTLDTDIMDFFLIAGWKKWHWVNPTYEYADEKLKKEIDAHLESKRRQLNCSNKIRSTRFVSGVVNHYPKKIRTIYDLKQEIESEGTRGMRDMGYAGLAYFNKTLQEFGIEPFKVGGRFSYAKTLKKYGLQKTKK